MPIGAASTGRLRRIDVPRNRPKSAPPLTLLCDEAGLDAWGRVEASWPAWLSEVPGAWVAPDEFVQRKDVRGQIVFVDVRDEAQMFRIVDIARDADAATVVLVSEAELHRMRTACPGAVVMPRSAPAEAIASAVHAMMVRQEVFREVHRDLDVSRRFQGGLRGEMEKIHEEMQLAAGVQRELLPKSMPSVPGACFDVLFQPASYVSGDIYNVQRLDERRVGFFLADAVGHGVPAALMTMLISRGIQLKTFTPDGYTLHTPGEALEALNLELVRRHASCPRFATAFAGTIDLETREVVLAGAGHPPALIYTPGKQVEPVHAQGGLLGVFEEDTFDDVHITLEEDQILVLYSDGFETAFPEPGAGAYEQRLPSKRYVERFAAFAEACNSSGMETALDELRAELNGAAGSLHQVDDITALFVGGKSAFSRSNSIAAA